MILSLERPLVTLMREIASAVNNSQFNVTGLQEQMQLAIEHTLKAAQQVGLFFYPLVSSNHCLFFFLFTFV